MKHIYIKRFLKKLTSLTSLLLLSIAISTSAIAVEKLDSKNWKKTCDEKNTVCIIGILNSAENDDGKNVNLITAYLSLGSRTERKMDLVNTDEKTYKLKEKNITVPVLNINFPLNVDLKKNPLLQVDEKNTLNLAYSHCNNQVGCATSIAINDEVIKLFKSGKEITLIMGIYGSTNNMAIKLPLKGFTKSYDSLLK